MAALPFRLVDLPGKGKGLVAIRDLPKGTLLLQVAPTAFVLDDARIADHCCVCMAPLPSDDAERAPARSASPRANAAAAHGAQRGCASCGFGALCAACLSEPLCRRVHELECPSLTRLRASGLASDGAHGDTRALRLLLRLLLQRREEALQSVAQRLAPPAWLPRDAVWDPVRSAAFASLVCLDDVPDADQLGRGGGGGGGDESATEGDDSDDADEAAGGSAGAEMSVEERLAHLCTQARFLCDSDARVGHSACAALLGRLFLNCHELTEPERFDRELGLGIYPQLSGFNHDCAPNVHIHLAPAAGARAACGAQLCARLVAGVAAGGAQLCARLVAGVAAGAELTISYLDLYQPVGLRQAQLRAGFRFDCACARCAAPDAADDEMGARRCPRAGCGAIARCARDARDATAAVRACDACGGAVPPVGVAASAARAKRPRAAPQQPPTPPAADGEGALAALEAAAAVDMRRGRWGSAAAALAALLRAAAADGGLHARHARVRRAHLYAAACARARGRWAEVSRHASALVRMYEEGSDARRRGRASAASPFGNALAAAWLLRAEGALRRPLARGGPRAAGVVAGAGARAPRTRARSSEGGDDDAAGDGGGDERSAPHALARAHELYRALLGCDHPFVRALAAECSENELPVIPSLM